ncbi:SDR family oxidoreductase [Acidobacteria bacterium AB60]|nr:SDR family oxidoreductase [Acidobacteria bacterium AB60]
MAQGRTALITGASSGFGLLTTVALARRGWHVLATMRDLGRSGKLEETARAAGVGDRLELVKLDVTQPEQIRAVADRVAAGPEPLHALVNNAGFALPGFAEDTSDAELREQLETNFLGAAAMTRALLPVMRRQGFGHVVMMSSISGRLGFPGIGSYAAAKFALEGWTESLRYEVKSAGIQVAIVEPGAFETDIWTRNAKLSAGMSDARSPNAKRVEKWRARVQGQRQKADPQMVADLIVRILETPRPRLRYVIGTDARMGLAMRAILPRAVFEALILKNTGME